MPEKSGYFSTDDPHHRLPDETIADRAASAGVLHVLRKPLLDESLISHIRGVLAERGTRH